MKDAIESYVIDDDKETISTNRKDKFNDFIEKMNISIASNGVLYTQDKSWYYS